MAPSFSKLESRDGSATNAHTLRNHSSVALSRRDILLGLTSAIFMGAEGLSSTRRACASANASPFLHLPSGSTVLFQGDSITDGGRQREGQDYNHIMGQDYAYMIAGRYGSEHPRWNLTFVNRGISGNTVADLTARWPEDTIALKPGLISILIGINDVAKKVNGAGLAESAGQYTETYDQVIQQSLTSLPDVRIVLGQPFVLPVGPRAANYPSWRTEVDKLCQAVAELSAKYGTLLIPYQTDFDEACKRADAPHWSWDGIHPTYAGHYLMATSWMRTVNSPPGGYNEGPKQQ